MVGGLCCISNNNTNNVIWELSWHKFIYPITKHDSRYPKINAINIDASSLVSSRNFPTSLYLYLLDWNINLSLTSGMDGQQHEVECIWVQQCQRYPSSSQQPLEARYPDVQQVSQSTGDFLPSEAILVPRDFFSFGFWVSRVLHQSARARSKPDTRHQHINLAYLPSCWIITSIHRITSLTPNITPDLAL